jgi:hypothetical protein
MRDECKRIGRNPAEIEISTGAAVTDLDTVKRYRDLGVSRLVSGPPAFDKEGIRRKLGEFGEKVIAKV